MANPITEFLAANVRDWDTLTDEMRGAWLEHAADELGHCAARGESLTFEIPGRYTRSGNPVTY